ncbi:hypothetical protein BB934_26120 [Microvirga ossetica]|uniref:Hydro-lyase n=1 Tax=Microvirga ossetica TaxID=1882682 RepID=A0A1B2EN45_9HYPH|nr:DUF1445 domain-containing protein [Microvirga ossetica]ANY81262.1 hypothetical protein BB934_26120 [Microvirga ossetica]
MIEAATLSQRFTDPAELRRAARTGDFTRTTSGHCAGFAQANIAILPRQYQAEFRTFCLLNPQPLPLLGVYDSPMLPDLGDDIDIRTDVPAYEVFDGERWHQVGDVIDFWRYDSVTFALGCSFGFEGVLMDAGVPIRNIEQGRTVSMYDTNIPTAHTTLFNAPMVVTMRPLRADQVEIARKVTGSLPGAHGAPVHVGRDCDAIGITDLSQPDYGDPVTIRDDEVPVFWACGVTANAALRRAGIPHVVHKPGRMLVTDVRLS